MTPPSPAPAAPSTESPRALRGRQPDLARRALVVSAAWAGALPGAWAAGPGVAPGSILIGQSIALQGGRNPYGAEVLAGIQALFSRVNAAGGVHRRQLVLRTLDDDNKAERAEANARALVKDNVFLLFGSIEGGPSTAVMKAADELAVPFFGPMAGSPTLRRPHQRLVFPVRAEHRDEFRRLVGYGSSIGLGRVAFLHADTEVGRQHLDNLRRACSDAGVAVAAALPLAGEVSDAQLDGFVVQLREARADMLLNHGMSSVYERLIRRVRAAGLRITLLGVNSGSTQLAAALGPLAEGMVFAQVVPSPWSRKTAIAREYHDAFTQVHRGRALSYGSMEGYLTAKALVLALTQAGPDPSRDGFVRALEAAPPMDLGGVTLTYRPGDHAGSSFVDLAIVSRDGQFLQ